MKHLRSPWPALALSLLTLTSGLFVRAQDRAPANTPSAAIASPAANSATPTSPWSTDRATTWYAAQPWPVGSNYLPAYAANELEMWQARTFNPKRIDTELGWAQGLGMTTMRVFLHDLMWESDRPGFLRRIDQFLTICQRHHIRPVFVLFDSCWDPFPHLGRQPKPRPGIHNSRWLQSPGANALKDPAQYPRLESYVEGVVGAFKNDDRILAWDIWNEPDNTNGSSYGQQEPPNKVDLVLHLLPQAFAWARSAQPKQPLTSGVWHGNWTDIAHLEPMEKEQIENSDIVSFHDYGDPQEFSQNIARLKTYGRPIICTEYMARPMKSTFRGILPVAKQDKVGAINWGFVAGKSQTYLPWDSWQHPYIKQPPAVWFHDIFERNGTPYLADEVTFIREVTGAPPR